MSTASSRSSTGRVTPSPTHKVKKERFRDGRHALAHLESMKGRVSPEMQKSPIKRPGPIDSPSHQMKSSFDFNEHSLSMDMTSIYMKDYCTKCTCPEAK